ncbi:MAG: helix-turn-helix transcriptional regulator [Ruminococcaceae bacterium]|nr:helix-turn-helix transcriptional regulator [Oscillospiraceae bacterium]
MNQAKIGKFIAECRRSNNLTQAQLAEKLNITDRAVSKWENGKSMPDSSIMLDLCKELGITVNDLLSGEVVVMENYNENSEKIILNMVKEKEKNDKLLLRCEILMGVVCISIMLALTVVASLVAMEEWLRVLLILIGLVPLLIACPFMLKIEQIAGYYECKKCGHKYVPDYKSVFAAMHINRTRYMKCPECNKKSWHKKVISKD